jgi:hypothetical protein
VDDSLRKDSTVPTSRDALIWRGRVNEGRVRRESRNKGYTIAREQGFSPSIRYAWFSLKCNIGVPHS